MDDDLSAGLASNAGPGWRALPPLPQDLPQGAKPLAAQVRAPDALARRLASVGVVADAAAGAALAPGQRLISRTGEVCH